MLDVDNAIPFLLERRLIDAADILDGELVVASAARRNRNLRVQGRGAAGYLLKQPGDPTEGGHRTLRAEAAFYRHCQDEPAAAPLRDVLPRLAYYDAEEALLALELYADARPLWAHMLAEPPPALPRETPRALGRALGTLHRTFRASGPTGRPPPAWLGDMVPWVMLVHKPGPDLLATITPANYQTLQILQTQEGLVSRLDALRKRWRPETVIHNDVKSDNVLVRPGREPGAVEVRLVDWELVQVGDPAWDLAGALQDLLGLWVQTMPLAAGLPPERVMAEAPYPAGEVQSVLRALWSGYRAAAGLGGAAAATLLARAVAFSAARLVQSAYEMAHVASTLPAASVILLQVAANVLDDPELAQVQLYGLHGGGGL
jgi:Ser/Thr protein kinase RdoA (MazF antagonist)